MPDEDICGGLTGIVLAGGLSSRLGHDKAELCLEGGSGIDLLARSVALLHAVCSRTLVIGRSTPNYDCVPDDTPRQGPVGGIATALRTAGTACLVISCDLPFMEGPVLQRLVDAHATRPTGMLCTLYRQQETGHGEALVAIYEPDCLSFFQDCLARGHLKISRVVPEDRQHFLPYSSRESLPFFNINYPADLEAARRIVNAAGPIGK